LSAAVPAKAPLETVPTKKMLIASTGGLMLPFLIGLLWELRVKRITNSSRVENATQARLVGEVAKFPSGTSSRRSRRVFEESIDSLRYNLFLSSDCEGVRSIAVASSLSGEGKSSVASQLAVSISKASGKRVLIIDADLRSPDQHEIFGLPMGPGLCKVLAGEVTLREAIDRSLGDFVHVLPAGRLRHSPHRLMSVSAMRDLVDSALEDYEYVVVDTAPVLSAGETLLVTAAVDTTLLCVMRDVSREDSVTRTTTRLEASGAQIGGMVFSGVPSREYAYKYGDYEYVAAGAEH
jgi:capsular exopolysaccharide synthesis family protein